MDTAIERCFLNGCSYHPPQIFKSIIFGEAIRLRRLNEVHENYLHSLEKLKEKCLNSDFNKKITIKIIEIATEWKDRFEPKTKEEKKKRIIWATPFLKLLNMNKKEKTLMPDSCVVYRNPPSLGTNLT